MTGNNVAEKTTRQRLLITRVSESLSLDLPAASFVWLSDASGTNIMWHRGNYTCDIGGAGGTMRRGDMLIAAK